MLVRSFCGVFDKLKSQSACFPHLYYCVISFPRFITNCSIDNTIISLLCFCLCLNKSLDIYLGTFFSTTHDTTPPPLYLYNKQIDKVSPNNRHENVRLLFGLWGGKAKSSMNRYNMYGWKKIIRILAKGSRKAYIWLLVVCVFGVPSIRFNFIHLYVPTTTTMTSLLFLSLFLVLLFCLCDIILGVKIKQANRTTLKFRCACDRFDSVHNFHFCDLFIWACLIHCLHDMRTSWALLMISFYMMPPLTQMHTSKISCDTYRSSAFPSPLTFSIRKSIDRISKTK